MTTQASVYTGKLKAVVTRHNSATPYWLAITQFTGKVMLTLACFGILIVTGMMLGDAVGSVFYKFMSPRAEGVVSMDKQ